MRPSIEHNGDISGPLSVPLISHICLHRAKDGNSWQNAKSVLKYSTGETDTCATASVNSLQWYMCHQYSIPASVHGVRLHVFHVPPLALSAVVYHILKVHIPYMRQQYSIPPSVLGVRSHVCKCHRWHSVSAGRRSVPPGSVGARPPAPPHLNSDLQRIVIFLCWCALHCNVFQFSTAECKL